MKKIELIAPAGNLNKLMTAFAFGADAVYLGIPEYSLRSRINEFSPAKIKSAVDYADSRGKKIYATVNIFPQERHLRGLARHIRILKEYKVAAVIVSDPGVLEVMRSEWPEAAIHLSTQANCINPASALFWKKQGVKRIILGRETCLEDIKKIRTAVPDVELEYFVHGAMCMAYSGRCFLSKYLTGRSANLGDCIQPCRWKYEVRSKRLEVKENLKIYGIEKLFKNSKLKIKNLKHGKAFVFPEGTDDEFEIIEEENSSYILNSKDLCLIKHLDELSKAGVTAFKIEGRTKSDYYVGMVTGAYRKALEVLRDKKLEKARKNEIIDYLYNEFEEKSYHRGFTTGFLFDEGESAQNLDNSHKIPNWEFCGQVIRNKNLEVRSKKYFVYIKVHNSIFEGDSIEIIRPFYDIIKLKIKKMIDADTGEAIEKAHGGKKQVVAIESEVEIPEFSLVRRKLLLRKQILENRKQD